MKGSHLPFKEKAEASAKLIQAGQNLIQPFTGIQLSKTEQMSPFYFAFSFDFI